MLFVAVFSLGIAQYVLKMLKLANYLGHSYIKLILSILSVSSNVGCIVCLQGYFVLKVAKGSSAQVCGQIAAGDQILAVSPEMWLVSGPLAVLNICTNCCLLPSIQKHCVSLEFCRQMNNAIFLHEDSS